MATTSSNKKSTKTQKLLPAGGTRISLRRLVIFASVTLNVGFIVLWVSLAATNSLDGLFMENGLARYCASNNDDKFSSATPQVKELRNYVCDTPGATQYFHEGLNKYYESKGIPVKE